MAELLQDVALSLAAGYLSYQTIYHFKRYGKGRKGEILISILCILAIGLE